MKLSTRGRYAVTAMIDIACNTKFQDDYISLFSIAQRNQISESYLEQLFIKLKKDILVVSAKGVKGGYKLAKNPEYIFIFDILNAVEQKVKIKSKESVGDCIVMGHLSGSYQLWNNLLQHIDTYLSNVSLADVIDNNLSAISTVTTNKEETNVRE